MPPFDWIAGLKSEKSRLPENSDDHQIIATFIHQATHGSGGPCVLTASEQTEGVVGSYDQGCGEATLRDEKKSKEVNRFDLEGSNNGRG